MHYLGECAVGVAEQEHNGEDGGDADGESAGAVARVHPEDDPAEHDQEQARHVHLDHVVAQVPLERERCRQDGVVAFSWFDEKTEKDTNVIIITTIVVVVADVNADIFNNIIPVWPSS